MRFNTHLQLYKNEKAYDRKGTSTRQRPHYAATQGRFLLLLKMKAQYKPFWSILSLIFLCELIYIYVYLVGEMALAFDPIRTFVRGINKNKHKHIHLQQKEEQRIKGEYKSGKIQPIRVVHLQTIYIYIIFFWGDRLFLVLLFDFGDFLGAGAERPSPPNLRVCYFVQPICCNNLRENTTLFFLYAPIKKQRQMTSKYYHFEARH